MRPVAAGRVALPGKEASQQSNLLTALRCVSGQVLLSAIPQVLIYQLSVQTAQTQVVFLSAIVITL